MIRRPCRGAGFSQIEVLVAITLIAVMLVPALRALGVGLDSAGVQARDVVLAHRAGATLETVLAEPFASLRTAAASAGNATTPSSYSEAAGPPNRILVYLSYYDAGDSDGDGNPFTILDPDADADNDPYTGDTPRIALLWVSVRVQGTAIAFESLSTE